MIGVILWSDPCDSKAVIWCEDHGDLAYMSVSENKHLPDRFFEVGDMVEFDVSTKRNLRLAYNTRRLPSSFGTCLKTVLTTSANLDEIETRASAKIVPFQKPGGTPTVPAPPSVHRRQV